MLDLCSIPYILLDYAFEAKPFNEHLLLVYKHNFNFSAIRNQEIQLILIKVDDYGAGDALLDVPDVVLVVEHGELVIMHFDDL